MTAVGIGCYDYATLGWFDWKVIALTREGRFIVSFTVQLITG